MDILPIFTSHYSIGCSILTLENPLKPEDFDPTYPASIIDICVKENIKDVFLVENNMAGFVSAYKNCKSNKLNFHFGIKCVLCNDMNDKSQDSLQTESKVIIWLKNTDGYKHLVNIYSKAATDGFYYRPRLDCSFLENNWNNDSLMLSIPFYYSFLHQNLLFSANCVPNFSFTKPTLLKDHNDLPFNYLLNKVIDEWCENYPDCSVINCKNIYYYKEEDFIYFLAYKAMQDRKTLDVPNVDHLGSNQFSFESWRKLTNG